MQIRDLIRNTPSTALRLSMTPALPLLIPSSGPLQPRPMNDLVVNNQLSSTIIDDQCSGTASSISKRVLDPIEQTIVINDRQALLHISSLSHADNAAVITDVQDAVLFEHRTQHALHIHAWRGVGVE